MSIYHTTIYDDNDDEIPIVVSYSFHRARKGARDCGRYLPIEPDEPAHIEISDVIGPNNKPIELTEKQRDAVDEEIVQHEYEMSLPPEHE